MDTATHRFMTGDTVTAAIKKYNGYFLSPDQLSLLLLKFKAINGDITFRPGDTVIVPIMRFQSDENEG